MDLGHLFGGSMLRTWGLWRAEGSLLRSSECSFPPQSHPEVPLFTDTVTFRMAPWIMTPNTQPPLELYVCR